MVEAKLRPELQSSLKEKSVEARLKPEFHSPLVALLQEAEILLRHRLLSTVVFAFRYTNFLSILFFS